MKKTFIVFALCLVSALSYADYIIYDNYEGENETFWYKVSNPEKEITDELLRQQSGDTSNYILASLSEEYLTIDSAFIYYKNWVGEDSSYIFWYNQVYFTDKYTGKTGFHEFEKLDTILWDKGWLKYTISYVDTTESYYSRIGNVPYYAVSSYVLDTNLNTHVHIFSMSKESVVFDGDMIYIPNGTTFSRSGYSGLNFNDWAIKTVGSNHFYLYKEFEFSPKDAYSIAPTPTQLSSVETNSTKVEKVMEKDANGQYHIYIIKGDKKYDLLGTEVQ